MGRNAGERRGPKDWGGAGRRGGDHDTFPLIKGKGERNPTEEKRESKYPKFQIVNRRGQREHAKKAGA